MQNILSHDGEVQYWKSAFSSLMCEKYYANLMNDINWKHDELTMFGKHVITKRKVAW
jgi:hypothetical protein